MNLEAKMKLLNDWKIDDEKKELSKEFQFKSYLKNISFVNAIAFLANKYNHHPDLFISFNKCIVKLTTHDDAAITEKDVDLALKIDELL